MGSGSAIKAGRALVELTADDSKLQQGLRRAQAKMRKFAKSTELAGRLAVTTGAAIIAPATIAAKMYSSIGDELDKMSQRTGVSVESLSELGFAASQSGSNLKTLEKGFKAMQTNLLNAERGLSTSIDNLDSLGLSIDDLKNKSPEEQFKLIADKIADIQDPSKKAAVAIGLLGRSGQSLIPLLSGGRKGMEDLQQKARDLGLTISTDAAKSAAVFTDKMDILAAVLRVNVFEIGAALAPAIIDTSKKIMDIAKETVTWIRENQETIVSIAKLAAEVTLAGAALLAFGSIATAVSNIAGLLSSSIGLASTAVKGFNTELAFLVKNPEVAIFAAVATAAIALAVALKKPTKEIDDQAKKMTKLREAGDRQRATDLDSLDRLKKLSNAGDLNARQMVEAKGLLTDLNSRYDILGITIGKNTVKINNYAASHKHLNDQFRKSAIGQLNNELKGKQRNIFSIEKKIGNAKISAANAGVLGGAALPFIKKSQAKIKTIKEEMDSLRARRDDLLAGATDKAAFTGGEQKLSTPTPASTGTSGETDRLKKLKAELAKINEDAARKKRTQIANEIIDIEKAGKAKIALIKSIAAEEKAAGRPKEAGRLQGQITDVERGIVNQIVAVKEREAKRLKSIDDEAKAAKLADSKNIVAEEKRITDEIARVRIEQTLKGAAKERALLALERQRALADAKETGIDTRLIDKLFRLKNQAIKAATAAAQVDVRQRVVGSFNVRSVISGSVATAAQNKKPEEDTAKSTEKTAQNTARIISIMERLANDGGLFFG